MKYQNIQNGSIATIIGQNEKSKTVQLEFEDGTTKDLSPSTFKRWWKRLDEDVAEESPSAETDAEVSKKPVEKVKKEKPVKKKERAEKEPKLDTQPILEFISEAAAKIGAIGYVREKQPNLHNFKVDSDKYKSVVFLVIAGRCKVEIHSKKKWLSETVVKKMVPVKHNFDVKLVVTDLDKDTKQLITELIKSFK